MKIQTLRRPISYLSVILFHLFQIFHLFISPVLIIAASLQGIINGSFVMFSVLMITSLFFGRAFCSWICPGGGIQDALSFVVKKKAKNTKLNYIKYFIFSVWITIITVSYILNGITKIDLSFGMDNGSLLKTLILSLGALVLILPLAFIHGKWASCKYICWVAPFTIIGTKIKDYLKIPSLNLVADTNTCTECKICDKNCPMNLQVMEMVKQGRIKNHECILCGNCVDSCKQKVIKFSITK